MLVLYYKVMPAPRILLAVRPLPSLFATRPPPPHPHPRFHAQRTCVLSGCPVCVGWQWWRNIRGTRLWAGAGLRFKPTLNPANKPARDGGERVITHFRTRNRRAELSTGKRNTLTWPYPRQMAGESLGQCCLNSGALGEGCQESVWELNKGLGQFPPAQEQPEAHLSSSSSGLTRVAQQRRATELCTLNSHLARCILDRGSARNQG